MTLIQIPADAKRKSSEKNIKEVIYYQFFIILSIVEERFFNIHNTKQYQTFISSENQISIVSCVVWNMTVGSKDTLKLRKV